MDTGGTAYDVRPASYCSDSEAILALWFEGFDDVELDVMREKLGWMYLNNPAGEGLSYLLCDSASGEAAGVQCLGARNWRYGGEDFSSGIMADFVVGQKHRSLGPALQLLKTVVSEGKKSLDIIYGFPNRKAQPVFRRAGYLELGRLSRYAKVLRSRRFLQGRLRPWLIPMASCLIDWGFAIKRRLGQFSARIFIQGEWLDDFDQRFDQLWEEGRKDSSLVSERSVEVLNWRFFLGPNKQDWKIFTIKNNTDLLAYIVFMVVDKVVIVGDFYAADPVQRLPQLFSLFSVEAAGLGCESISLEFFGCEAVCEQLAKAGFKRREDNPVYYLPCNQKLASLGRLDWYITGFDRDT